MVIKIISGTNFLNNIEIIVMLQNYIFLRNIIISKLFYRHLSW